MKREMKIHYATRNCPKRIRENYSAFCGAYSHQHNKENFTRDWSKVTCKNCRKRLESEHFKAARKEAKLFEDVIKASKTNKMTIRTLVRVVQIDNNVVELGMPILGKYKYKAIDKYKIPNSILNKLEVGLRFFCYVNILAGKYENVVFYTDELKQR